MENIVDAIARALVTAQNSELIFLDNLKIKNRNPELLDIVRRGLREFERDARYKEKTKLKVMAIDPHWFSNKDLEIAKYAQSRPLTKAEIRLEEERKQHTEKTKKLMDHFNMVYEFWEKWHLSDGTPLGNATKISLQKERDLELAKATGIMKNVRFYDELISRIPDDTQTVKQAVPIEVAHMLREKIYVNNELSQAA